MSPARPKRCPGCPGRQRGTMARLTSTSGCSSSFSHTDVWSNNNNNSMRLTYIYLMCLLHHFLYKTVTHSTDCFLDPTECIMYPIQIRRVWEARSTILGFSNFNINNTKLNIHIISAISAFSVLKPPINTFPP